MADDYSPERQSVYSEQPEEIVAVARCIYPFDSTNEVELNLAEGDMINVTRKDVGGGWWEGELNGRHGLFPETYIELVHNGPPGGAAASSAPAADSGAAAAARAQPKAAPRAASAARPAANAANAPAGVPVILPAQLWRQSSEMIVVQTTTKAEKGKKFSGMKTFTVYEISSSASPHAVERRFKHFDWLHARLAEQFPCINIPPTPGKQMSGRFEDEFVESRRRELEMFLNRVARHPILGTSSVFHHFLTASDQKEWKSGKRDAEREGHESRFVNSVVVSDPYPSDGLDLLSAFSKFGSWLDKQVAGLITQCEDILKQRRVMADAYEKLGGRYNALADPAVLETDRPKYTPWWIDGPDDLTAVLNTFGAMGEGVTQIAKLMKDQENHDRDMYVGFLKEHHGLLKAIVTVHKQHDGAWDEYHKELKKETTPAEKKEELKTRCETRTQIVMAEYRHMHDNLVYDMNIYMREFIQQQVEYHRKTADMWEKLAAQYPEYPAAN